MKNYQKLSKNVIDVSITFLFNLLQVMRYIRRHRRHCRNKPVFINNNDEIPSHTQNDTNQKSPDDHRNCFFYIALLSDDQYLIDFIINVF